MTEEAKRKLAELEARQVRLLSAIERCTSASADLGEEMRLLRREILEVENVAESKDDVETPLPLEIVEKKIPPPLPETREEIADPVAAKVPEPVIEKPIKAENPTAEKPQQAAKSSGEWELDFGRVWLVRIGMVMLLTGLVFLSTYAYQNWLFKAGPAVKVSFFMAISLAISALGVFLEKKVARLHQYGQVLIAGGLGAGYYTLYAAHFVPFLKIIDSQVLAGVILSLWAGMMLYVAVRKKSELVAVMSLGLAFYGTVVNPASGLALFSSLLLSATGMWLLLRHRWLSLGLSTMLAAYGAQAYWWGLYPQAALTEVVRLAYPLSYWLLFMTFLALPQARNLPEKMLRVLGGLNNGAAWALLVFSKPNFMPHENFDWMSIGAGGLLLILAALTRSGRVWPRALGSVFGGQGVFFLTLGIMVAASGYSRFLILAAEASVLLLAARFYGAAWLRLVSGIVFVAALLYAAPEPKEAMQPWGIYLSLTFLSAVYTVLLRREAGEIGRFAALITAGVTWAVWYFGVLGQWSVDAATLGLCFSLVGVVALATWVKKTAFLVDLAGVAYLVAFGAAIRFLYLADDFSSWFIMLSLATTGFFWWLSPRVGAVFPDEGEGKVGAAAFEWIFAAMLCLSLGRALTTSSDSLKLWLLLAGAFALGGGAVGEWLKRPSLAVTVLFFYPVMLFLEFVGTVRMSDEWLLFLPLIYILAHFVLVDCRWKIMSRKVADFALAPGALLLAWMPFFVHFDRPEMGYLILGLFFGGWGLWRGGHGVVFLAGFGTLAFSCFWAFGNYGREDWLRYLPVMAALGFHAVLWVCLREKKEWEQLRIAFFALGIFFLLLMLSLHVLAHFSGSGLTIAWAVLSGLLFGLGLLMHCRPYRLMALIVMVGAVGNVMLVDVMRLGSLGRILSFLTLGVVLLALGFLYNRYQDQIRKFL